MNANILRKREKRRLRNRTEPVPFIDTPPPSTEEVWQRVIDDPNIFKTPKGNVIRVRDAYGSHYLTPSEAARHDPEFWEEFDAETGSR